MTDKDVVKTEGLDNSPSETGHRTKDKVKALFGWVGGKHLLRDTIAKYVPEQDKPIRERRLKYYVEVFGGMAWMLLYKPRWFETEVYNDFNNELPNLFNVVKCHPHEFYRQIRDMPNSQFMFDYFQRNEPLTDIQKAFATYVKYTHSFSSLGEHYSVRAISRLNILKRINELSRRLDRVSIMHLHYKDLIERFNRPNVFLYLDPPYYFYENLYQVTIERKEHTTLRNLLREFKGKFILSYNDCPEVRSLYEGFHIESLSTIYSAGSADNKPAKEVLIMNYSPIQGQ